MASTGLWPDTDIAGDIGGLGTGFMIGNVIYPNGTGLAGSAIGGTIGGVAASSLLGATLGSFAGPLGGLIGGIVCSNASSLALAA